MIGDLYLLEEYGFYLLEEYGFYPQCVLITQLESFLPIHLCDFYTDFFQE